MNIDTENRQLLPDDPPPITAAAEDLTSNFTLSVPQDRAAEDDASVHEEGSLPASIGDDDYYDEKISFGDDDEDVRNVIKRLHSEDTAMTQSTSGRDYAERNLPDDTFSFLIYSDVCSQCFLCGILVFLFQMSIYVVLANDIINLDNNKNPFGFPFNVSIPVRISEVLAIFISILTQHDVRKALCLYRDGFDKDKEGTSMDKITQVFPGATVWKWTLSIVSRASQGFLGLIITFLLIMRSNSVLDLLLNFSAIEFVAELDDVVFGLAKEGLLGNVLKKEAKDMEKPKKSYHVSKECLNTKYAMKMSLGYFVVLFSCFFGSWLYIYWQQRNGEYLCQQIFSQFGDEILPMLGTFTGLFYKHEEKFGDRASYRDDQPGGPLLGYCKSETRWTLSLTKDDKWDPCNWLAASSESESYSILSTTSSPWVIKTPTNRAAPLTHHFLMCYECTHVDNFCGDYGSCVPAGKYDKCICNKEKGRYGLRCEYSKPCQVVEAEGFSKEGGGLFTSKYYMLEGVDT
eukprot:scaffold12054_cov112-Skeletonema_dohrnii-CCMP3373.AAC.6